MVASLIWASKILLEIFLSIMFSYFFTKKKVKKFFSTHMNAI